MDLFTIGIIFVVVGLGLVWYFNRNSRLDVNQDGKVNVTDAKAAVTNTVAGVKAAADVNQDGKVNFSDAKAAVDLNKDGKVSVSDAAVAVTEVKAAVKKVATKAKTVAAKKPAAKTVAAKKPGRKPKEA